MRETQEVQSAVCRLVRALGNRIGQEDPEGLWHLARVEVVIEQAYATAVAGLREGGHTDKDIGEVLGTTRQNVQQRWPRTERVVGAGARYRAR